MFTNLNQIFNYLCWNEKTLNTDIKTLVYELQKQKKKFIKLETVLPKYLIQVSRKKSIFAPLSSAILDFTVAIFFKQRIICYRDGCLAMANHSASSIE